MDSQVNLSGRTRTWSLFATDTLTLAEHWHLTLSARWNQTRLSVRDHITRAAAPARWTATTASAGSTRPPG